MPIQPCATVINCPDCQGGPLANLTAEGPDNELFVSSAYVFVEPPLGTTWNQNTCLANFFSSISQADADAQALAAATACATSGWTNAVNGNTTPDLPPVPPPQGPAGGLPFRLVGNTPQQGTAFCPDGLPYFYPVPARMFFSTNLASANAMAQSYGDTQANLHVLCFSNLPDTSCLNTPYNETITASSAFLATGDETNAWALTSGSLPPGLTFNGGNLGNQATITGTPTTPGDYDFVIGITLPNGDFNQKEYFVTIAGLTNGNSLPNATIGTAYSATLTASGFASPVFSISDVPLPDGLSMDSAGNISGTPASDAMSGTFPVFVRDSVTDFECSQDATITVNPGGLNFNNLVWGTPFLQSCICNGGTGTASGTWNQDSMTIDFTTPIRGGSQTQPGNAECDGQLTYTGDMVSCNVHIVITGTGTLDGGLPGDDMIEITQDGTPILDIFAGDFDPIVPGSFDYAFTVSAGVASIIKVSTKYAQNSKNSGATSCHLVVTLTPAS